MVKIRLDPWKSLRPFKGIICHDISDESSARASTVASTSRESTPSHAGLLWEPQGLVQMRVVEDIPEPIYAFTCR